MIFKSLIQTKNDDKTFYTQPIDNFNQNMLRSRMYQDIKLLSGT